MKSRQLIQELVSSAYMFKWTNPFTAHFTTKKGSNYEVEFLMSEGIYNMYFYTLPESHFLDRTKEGDSFKVLATVFKILNDFLVKHPLDMVRFSGGDKVQERLYKKALNRYISKFDLEYYESYDYFYVAKRINAINSFD